MSTEITTTATRKHHRRSPSTLQPREVCPGYESENNETEASRAGQHFHDCIEKRDLDALTDERAEKAQACIDYGDMILRECGPGAYNVEEEYLPIDEKDTTAGYLDRAVVTADGSEAHVIDYKSGLNAVETVDNNLQGMSYVLGLDYRLRGTLKKATVHFLMPFQRFFNKESGQWEDGLIDVHTFQRDEFDRWHLRIQTIVARSKKVDEGFEEMKRTQTALASEIDVMLNPTDGTCLFCARKAECPALHRLVLRVGHKYAPLAVPVEVNPTLISDPADAGRAIKFFDVMSALATAFRARCTDKALTDENFMPEGYGIVTTVRRKIIDKEKFAETVKPLLTEKEFFDSISFTFGAVEDAISAKAPRGKKKAAVEELSLLLDMNGATVEGEPIHSLRQKKEKAPALTV